MPNNTWQFSWIITFELVWYHLSLAKKSKHKLDITEKIDILLVLLLLCWWCTMTLSWADLSCPECNLEQPRNSNRSSQGRPSSNLYGYAHWHSFLELFRIYYLFSTCGSNMVECLTKSSEKNRASISGQMWPNLTAGTIFYHFWPHRTPKIFSTILVTGWSGLEVLRKKVIFKLKPCHF